VTGAAFARRAVVARDALARGRSGTSSGYDSPNLLTLRSRVGDVAPLELLHLGPPSIALRASLVAPPLSDGGTDVASEGLASLPHEGEEVVGLEAGGTVTVGAEPAAPQRCPILIQGDPFFLPEQFGVIEDGVYRGAYPTPDTYPFLARLGLRTVVNLLDKFTEEYRAFTSAAGITYVPLPVKGNKAHCEEMDRDRAATALALLLDVRHHPILVHCRSGKHRTGALVGCLRMLQAWSVDEACTEYVIYCRHKQREVDKQYIERFDPRRVAPLLPPTEHLVPWLSPDCCTKPSAWEMSHGSAAVAAAAARGCTEGATDSDASGPEVGPAVVGPAVPAAALGAAVGRGSHGHAGCGTGGGRVTESRPTILRDGKGRSAFSRDPPPVALTTPPLSTATPLVVATDPAALPLSTAGNASDGAPLPPG
jgi:tyrosine-protein phosphatase SIW14